MQIARPRVVAEAGPEFEYRFKRRRRQFGDAREAIEKALVVGNDRTHLRLLQHDLRQPDAIRIARVLPRQIVAPVPALPVSQTTGKGIVRRDAKGIWMLGHFLTQGFSTVHRLRAIIGAVCASMPSAD